MGIEAKPLADLVMIARAGGGFTLDATRWSTNDLISLARAASILKPRLILNGIGSRPTSELQAIARAGQGSVVFEDKPLGGNF